MPKYRIDMLNRNGTWVLSFVPAHEREDESLRRLRCIRKLLPTATFRLVRVVTFEEIVDA